LPATRDQKCAGTQDREVRNGNGSGLLRKRQRQFPNANNQRINENRENTVLKFAREISADPRVRAKQRDLTVVPCPRHIGEDRQDGNFVVVVPKNEGIVREQEDAEGDDDQSGDRRTDYLRTRKSRPRHSAISTPNVQGPTSEAQRGEARSGKS
jgi:hypothetical protein